MYDSGGIGKVCHGPAYHDHIALAESGLETEALRLALADAPLYRSRMRFQQVRDLSYDVALGC